MDSNSLMNRLMRVFRFDASVYREVAADASAQTQAYTVVALAVVATTIGVIISGLLAGDMVVGLVTGVLAGVGTVVSYVLYSLVAALVAQNMFQGKTNFQEMMRTLGFVYGWNILGILNAIPLLGALIGLVIWVLAIISTVLALRESAEFDTTKAAITAIIAGVVGFFASFCVLSIIGIPLMAMLGLASGAGQ
ncbi:MAG: YIP1 family protein [Anaerolineales bacterium]